MYNFNFKCLKKTLSFPCNFIVQNNGPIVVQYLSYVYFQKKSCELPHILCNKIKKQFI